MITHYVSLDLSQRDCRKVIPICTEDTGHKIVFTISHGIKVIPLSGATATVTVRNGANDGAGVVDDCEVYPADNVIEYSPSHNAVAIEGNIVCILTVFRSDGSKFFAHPFYLYVADAGAANIDTELNKAVAASDAWGVIANLKVCASAAVQAVTDASGYASNASTYASRANSYANSANTYYKSAKTYSENARTEAGKAMGWAVGEEYTDDDKRREVQEDHDSYQNNAKYFSGQASGYASAAEESAGKAASSESNAEGFASAAAGSAEAAAGSAEAAASAKQKIDSAIKDALAPIEDEVEALKTDLEDGILRINTFIYNHNTHTLSLNATTKNFNRENIKPGENTKTWSVDLALESAIIDVEDTICEEEASENYGKPMIRFKMGSASDPTYSSWFPLESLVRMSNYVKNEEFENYTDETDETLDTLNTRIAANEESITQLDNSISEQKEKIEELEGKIDEASTPKSEWDFVIDSYDRLGEISNMFGNVLIQCEVPAENYATINVPKSVKHLKIDITIEGYANYGLGTIIGHHECVLEGCFFGYDCSVASFKEVRYSRAPNGTIRNCDFVYGCTALEFKSCKYVELASIESTGSNEGMSATFSGCNHICHVDASYTEWNPLIIENCDIVENIAGGGSTLTIKKASTVDTVSGFSKATYENCEYVNPHTCQDYVTAQNAEGKVQVLTADGSFVAVEIGGGDEDISQRVTALEEAINGVEEELQMLNEGGIE